MSTGVEEGELAVSRAEDGHTLGDRDGYHTLHSLNENPIETYKDVNNRARGDSAVSNSALCPQSHEQGGMNHHGRQLIISSVYPPLL